MVEEVIDGIYWTPTAKATFNSIVEYLHKEWSEKEVRNLQLMSLRFYRH